MNKQQARLKLGDKKLTGDRNQCPSCGELFNSNAAFNAAFDKHRKPISWFVGTSKEESKSLDSIPRRCLSLAEMSHLGMVKNNSAFWVGSAFSQGHWAEAKPEDTEEEVQDN